MLKENMIFKDTINIENKTIGKNHPCLVIAEAGISHFGDIKIARDLVDMAVDSGADVFKTQIFEVDNLISKNANVWKDRLRPRNLNFDQIWPWRFERVIPPLMLGQPIEVQLHRDRARVYV